MKRSLLSPLISYGNDAFRPASAVLAGPCGQRRTHALCFTLPVSSLQRVSLQPVAHHLRLTTWLPRAAASRAADAAFFTSHEAAPRDRLTLEELSFLLPIFWMKMFL